MNILCVVSFVSLISYVFCQKKDLLPKRETLYASSLFRMNRVLDGVPQLESLKNVPSVSICLLNCMKRLPDCKSFNWGNGDCVLMSDSLCLNETLTLTEKEGYAYYDIMESPDFEVIERNIFNQFVCFIMKFTNEVTMNFVSYILLNQYNGCFDEIVDNKIIYYYSFILRRTFLRGSSYMILQVNINQEINDKLLIASNFVCLSDLNYYNLLLSIDV